MTQLKGVNSPFYYLRNINEIVFDKVSFLDAGVLNDTFFSFADGISTDKIKIKFSDCPGILEKKLFDDHSFSKSKRIMDVTIEFPTQKPTISVLDENNFKFLLHRDNVNLNFQIKDWQIDCSDCKNNWILRPKNFVECDDGLEPESLRHFRC